MVGVGVGVGVLVGSPPHFPGVPYLVRSAVITLPSHHHAEALCRCGFIRVSTLTVCRWFCDAAVGVLSAATSRNIDSSPKAGLKNGLRSAR